MIPTADAEEQFNAAEIAEIEQWWAQPRFKNVYRPYTAKSVVEPSRPTMPAT